MWRDLTDNKKLNGMLFIIEDLFRGENFKISPLRTQAVLIGDSNKDNFCPKGILINGMEFNLYEGVKVKFDINGIRIFFDDVLVSNIRMKDIKDFDCWI